MKMALGRREFSVAVMATVGGCALPTAGDQRRTGGHMFGLIGKMTAAPGKREELIGLLLTGTEGMPGCLSYIVARDVKDENAIWISEVWDNKDSHAASLKLPAVQATIAKARPMIAGFSDGVTTEPVGGVGLPK
jgi:quinol monooxygenase YgiN